MDNRTEIVDEYSPRCDVLLVVATKVELEAILAAAKDYTGKHADRSFGANKTYYDLGTIADTRVFVVRTTRMGSGSRGSSIITIADALREVKSKVIILVGIAFGIDPEKTPIGTILVSEQIKVYERQRVGTDHCGDVSIIFRGDKSTASTRLLDRFQDADIDWAYCKTVFGLLLSGEKLIDNVDFRQKLLDEEPEALGGEMEGAGLYAAAEHCDWIIVKAVCDFADGKKGEGKTEKQMLAARNAAYFVMHTIAQGGISPIIYRQSIVLVDLKVDKDANLSIEAAKKIVESIKERLSSSTLNITAINEQDGIVRISLPLKEASSLEDAVRLHQLEEMGIVSVSYPFRIPQIEDLPDGDDCGKCSKEKDQFFKNEIISVKLVLQCEDEDATVLHLRPASQIISMCQKFPEVEFVLERLSDGTPIPVKLMSLVCAELRHGDKLQLTTAGKGAKMAAAFVKICMENLSGFSDKPAITTERINRLIDDAFNEGNFKSDSKVGGNLSYIPEPIIIENESRSTAVINDRLHNLSLMMIPLIAKHYQCRLQISFVASDMGIYSFEISEKNDFSLDPIILHLHVDIGTQITVLTWGEKRFVCNEIINKMLQSLWQCDMWLKNKLATDKLESVDFIPSLISFISEESNRRSKEYEYANNPVISNMLTERHVFINGHLMRFSKEDVLRQLCSPHIERNNLNREDVVTRLKKAEEELPILTQDNFALTHATLDNCSFVSLSIGIYKAGVEWTKEGEKAYVVVMAIFSRHAHAVWRDYMRKIAILFRSDQNFTQELLAYDDATQLINHIREKERLFIG